MLERNNAIIFYCTILFYSTILLYVYTYNRIDIHYIYIYNISNSVVRVYIRCDFTNYDSNTARRFSGEIFINFGHFLKFTVWWQTFDWLDHLIAQNKELMHKYSYIYTKIKYKNLRPQNILYIILCIYI